MREGGLCFITPKTEVSESEIPQWIIYHLGMEVKI